MKVNIFLIGPQKSRSNTYVRVNHPRRPPNNNETHLEINPSSINVIYEEIPTRRGSGEYEEIQDEEELNPRPNRVYDEIRHHRITPVYHEINIPYPRHIYHEIQNNPTPTENNSAHIRVNSSLNATQNSVRGLRQLPLNSPGSQQTHSEERPTSHLENHRFYSHGYENISRRARIQTLPLPTLPEETNYRRRYKNNVQSNYQTRNRSHQQIVMERSKQTKFRNFLSRTSLII